MEQSGKASAVATAEVVAELIRPHQVQQEVAAVEMEVFRAVVVVVAAEAAVR